MKTDVKASRKYICNNCGHVNNTEETLTVRQKEILEFIREKVKETGKFPTIVVIAKHFGIHISGAHTHLQHLTRKKFIKHINRYEL